MVPDPATSARPASPSPGVCVPIPTYARMISVHAGTLRAAITPKTKALIFPYPNNPTGADMRKEHVQANAEVLEGTNVLVIADEIYAELTYGNEAHTAFASVPGMWERTITLNGFSKAFAMTGWRMGYACGPQEIVAVMCKIHQYTMLCALTPGQYAALL